MRTMNGFTSELLVKRAKRNWRTRCGAFLLAVLAAYCGGDVYGATLTTTADWGANTAIDNVQTANRVAPFGNNIGAGQGYEITGLGNKTIQWDVLNGNQYGVDLADVADGLIDAHLLITPVAPALPYRAGTYTFGTNAAFAAGTGDNSFTTSHDVIWNGTFDASNGTYNTQGNNLTINGAFSNTTTFTVNHGYSTGGWLQLNNGSNTGTINIGTGSVRLDNNFSNAGGTIDISQTGVLALTQSYNLTGTLVGQGSQGGRGIVQLEGDASFSGAWTGTVTIDSQMFPFSGYELNAANVTDASALSVLQVQGGASVVVDSQSDIGNAGVILTGGGTLAKYQDAAQLTLNNNITVGGQGGLDAYGGTLLTPGDQSDFIYDVGNRFVLTGNLSSSSQSGNTLYINSRGGLGAVSLQGNGSAYWGAYQISAGTLEVADTTAGTLGQNGNQANDGAYAITIGDAMTPEVQAAFRVINAQNTSTTNARQVILANELSTYEVFTGNINALNTDLQNRDSTVADAARAKVIQTGIITGAGSLNKAGDGVLVLAASANSYTGDTNIQHGVLSISNTAQLGGDTASKVIRIGADDQQAEGYRPVLETTLPLGTENSTLTINRSKVEINQVNSVIRTTGKGNETVINSNVTSSSFIASQAVSEAPVLNKEGAGTLTLNGTGTWGYNGTGKTNIVQGTLQFYNKNNLAAGDITIGLDRATVSANDTFNKDVDNTVPYEAILKLTNGMGYQQLPNNVVLGSAAASVIEVGAGSNLGVNQVREAAGVSADLNKRGEGELTLNGVSTYTGWTNVEAGSVILTQPQQIASSKGVDLIGENTTLDMTAADQTLRGLRGGITAPAVPGGPGAAGDPRDFRVSNNGYNFANSNNGLDNPEYWTREVLIGDKNLTLDIQNTKQGDQTGANYFRGNIVGTGTVTKKGNSTFGAGFVGFDGAFDIQGGRMLTLSDTSITGITGKAGTFLDVLDNTLTIDIAASQKYSGTIISTATPDDSYRTAKRPVIVKDGVGTLTAGFYSDPAATGTGEAYRGDLTLKQGNIISTTDFHMASGGTLTFYADMGANGSVTPLVLQVGENREKAAVFGDGANVRVEINSEATGWNAPKGNLTVGIVEGNSNSYYDGMKVDAANSLFHEIQLNQVIGTARKDLHIDIDVKGFSGVGSTYNTIAVGENLDNIRLLDLHGNNLENLLKDVWSAGSHITSEADRSSKLGILRNLYQQLAGETIANAAFMGLDRPWQRPFEHLNLDSQMVYLTPPGVSGSNGQRPIANMRNLWFTPTVQSISARSDGNARKFGIERSGFQIGFDKRVAQNTSLGFVLGQSSPNLRTADDRVEGNDFQFGLYGGTMIGYYVEMKGFIGFGHQNYKSNRSVYFPNDAIVPDSTVAGGYRPIGGVQRSMTAHGRFDGDTFNFSFEVSRPLFLGFAILRPTIGLDSEHAYRYGFTETGDAVAMNFDRGSLSRTRLRLGMGLESCTFDRTIFKGYLGYSANLGGRDYATASGQFVNVYAPNQTVRSVAVGKSYFDAGVGTKIFLNPSKTLSLDANYNASVADHWSEHLGDVGFIYVY